MKTVNRVLCIIGIAMLFASCNAFINKKSLPVSQPRNQPTETIYASSIMSRAGTVRNYTAEKNFSMSYCFLVDMGIHSGRKRFFIYDLEKNKVIMAGLVAHGSCNETFLDEAKFSNAPGGGCTSLGKYRIGEKYWGDYGRSYKLYGLESTNSNAYKRAIVLHSYSCIPDEEIYPRVACNSFGCAGVSPAFFEKLASIIDRSKKPIVLWIYK